MVSYPPTPYTTNLMRCSIFASQLREVAEENHEEVPASGWLKWDEMGVFCFDK